MPRLLRMVLIGSLVAFVPLRAMTAAITDLCFGVHQSAALESAVQADAGDCPGGAAAVVARRPAMAPTVAEPVFPAERGTAAFVPDRPDPPPLAFR